MALLIGTIAAYALWLRGQPIEQYARVFYQLGHDCEACPLPQRIQLAEQAIHHDSAFSDGYTRMGILLKEADRTAEAVAYHHQAVLYDPRNRLSFIELGIHYFQQEDLDLALRYLLAANAVTGYGDTLNYYMGRVYERRGDDKNAAWYYLRAYQFNPQNLIALARLASIDHRHGDKKSSLKVAEEIRNKGEIALAAELEAFTKTDGKTEFMAYER